jgi:WD40 repeat protein
MLSLLSNSDLGAITQAAWAPDGRHLALSGPLGVAWLNIPAAGAGAELGIAWANPDAPADAFLQVSADGTRLLAHGSTGHTVLLDTADGRQVAQLLVNQPGESEVRTVLLSPDAHLLAVSDNWNVTLYSWASGTPVMLLQGDDNAGDILALGFNADGQRLTAGSEDGDLQVWNTNSGILVRYVDANRGELFHCKRPYPATPGGLLALICDYPSNDFRTDNIEVWLWDPANDQNQYVYYFTDNGANYGRFAFGPGHNYMAFIAQSELLVWTLPDGMRQVSTLPAQPFTGWAFNPADQGRTLALWDAQAVRFYDSTSGRLASEYRLPGSNAAVQALAFVANPVLEGAPGRLLALGRADGVVELWNAADGRLQHVFDPQPAASWTWA